MMLLALALAPMPAPAASDTAVPCQLDGNQREMNECAQSRYMQADAEMSASYQAQMAYLGALARKRLLASQRAWLAYRDAACLYENGIREGSMWPMLDASCREALTTQRAQMLKSYVECRSNGCPE
jgi:uncharacterized protein YecT (DUF1311 family)